MATPSQLQRDFSIATDLDDAIILRGFTYSDSLNELFNLTADVEAVKSGIDLRKLLGTNATIRIEDFDTGHKRFLNGMIVRVSQTALKGNQRTFQLTIAPNIWMLTRTVDCRIYQDKTVPAIIEDVLKRAGISDFTVNLRSAYKPWEYCVQYRESNLAFITRLMEQEGIFYFFKHENGRNTMELVDDPGALSVLSPNTKLAYEPLPSGTANEDGITDWRLDSGIEPEKVTLADFNFKRPTQETNGTHKLTIDDVLKGSEVFDYPGEFEETGDGPDYAKIRSQAFESHQEIYAGATEFRGILTGYRFTLIDPEGVLHESTAQEYSIIEVNLRGVVESSESGSSGHHFSCGFKAIPAKRHFRAHRITPKPVIAGPQTATVTGPNGEEIHCDDHGRVKVKFHWDRHGPKDDKSSCWVRVQQAQAGLGRGNIYVPRITDEVIVEFLEGDPDRPIITGSVYNGVNKPPFELPKNNMQMGYKSISTPGGGGFNEFSMNDTAGKELINIHAQYDMTTTVQHDQTDTINNNRTTTIKVDDKETIQGKQEVAITGNQTVKVDGNQSNTVKGNLEEKVNGNTTQSTIGDVKVTAVGKGEISTTGNLKVASNGGQLESFAATNYMISSGVKCEISSTMIKLSASGNTIELGPAGIKISGLMIDISAMAITTIKGALVKVNS
jgi:type VI secretion system secreted protein VgrG